MTAGADKAAKVPSGSAHWTARMLANPYLLLATASLFWSGNHIVGRAAGGHVPSLAMSTARWLIPAIVLWALAHRQIRQDWPTIRAHWKMMLWLGLTGGALFTALQYVGLKYTSALNVSVLNSLVPVLIVATAALLFRDRVSLRQTGGIAISLLGVLVIVAHGRFETLMALGFNWGDLIIIFNMIVFAVYAVYLRLRPRIHALSFLFVLAVISSAGTLPFFIIESLSGDTLQLTWLTVMSIGYVAIFPSVLAFAAWNKGVELIGANRAGPFVHLVPVYTALVAGALLGEHLAGFHVA
ncbi:MAG: DMT family transporter, partial [Pseudolabrys sp.]|nr:DMT family transporter [Pseudolabrys sp.]